jgi:hypothetical protein
VENSKFSVLLPDGTELDEKQTLDLIAQMTLVINNLKVDIKKLEKKIRKDIVYERFMHLHAHIMSVWDRPGPINTDIVLAWCKSTQKIIDEQG